MGLTGSLNINLKRGDWASVPHDYADLVSQDSEHVQNLQNIDKAIGLQNQSHSTIFETSGAIDVKNNSKDYWGSIYNGQCDRIIDAAYAWVLYSPVSGSGDTINPALYCYSSQPNQPIGGFVGQTAFTIPLSKGAFSVTTGSAGGLSLWPKNSLLFCFMNGVTGAASGSNSAYGLHVQIDWHPSGSW